MKAETFFSLIRRGHTSDCWEWLGSKNRDGYGSVWFALGDRATTHGAHKVSLYLHTGIKPSDRSQEVMHDCDNRICVNPNHLRLGTHRENMADCAKRGRIRLGGVGRGEKHPNAKLSDADALSMRNRRANGEKLSVLAREAGISNAAASRICNKKRWTHL